MVEQNKTCNLHAVVGDNLHFLILGECEIYSLFNQGLIQTPKIVWVLSEEEPYYHCLATESRHSRPVTLCISAHFFLPKTDKIC